MDIFSHIFAIKIVMIVCWKDENKPKRGRGGPFFKKSNLQVTRFILELRSNYKPKFAYDIGFWSVIIIIRNVKHFVARFLALVSLLIPGYSRGY